MNSRSLQILDITTTTVDTELFNITAINQRKDPYWVEFIERYLNEIDIEINVLPLAKIDKTKKWLINVDILNNNWYEHEGDIFSGFSEEILHEIVYGHAYLLLNHQCESYTDRFFNILYKTLQAYPSVPFRKIIYMVAAIDVHVIYENFCREHSIADYDKIDILYTHHVYKRFNHGVDLQIFKYDRSVKKEKKFLNLNRRWREHRLLMVSYLSHLDLLAQGYVSLGVEPHEQQAAHQWLKEISIFFGLEEQFLSGFEKIKDDLPLKTDMVDLAVNQFEHHTLPIEFYQKSCFSLVSSTHAIAYSEKSAGFTEKEIKPILAKHPFIIHNRPGVLKELKNQGFLTFSKWFDESYDSEEDDIKRLQMIAHEVERLCALTFDQWHVMLEQMQPVVDHNYNRMINYTNEHCFFNSDLKNLVLYAD